MSEGFSYASFDVLRQINDHMMSSAERSDRSLGAVPTEDIDTFLSCAAATGGIITDWRERRDAETIIRFWAAELIARGSGGGDWAAPRLAPPFDKHDVTQAASPAGAAGEADLDRSRALVRISASARQWRTSGDRGWLLKDDALREALSFVGVDEDIRALVAASQAAELSAGRRLKAGLGGIVVVLAVLSISLYLALQTSREAQHNAEAAEQAAVVSREAANAQSAETIELNRALQATLAEQAARSREQQQELDRKQDALRDVARLVRDLRAAGQIDDTTIPETLKSLIATLDRPAPPTDAPPESLSTFIRGYDPAFLQASFGEPTQISRAGGGIVIPLPRLTDPVKADAFEDGRPIHYVNFSIVFNRARRMPILSAVNLRRSAVVPIARTYADRFRYEPRLPRELQPPPDSFARNDLDRGHLVNARDMAWGPAFGGDSAEAGQRAYGQINVTTNLTPQYDTFNRGLWLGAERYAREGFSAKSDRVTIFSGPILTAEDPVVGGVGVPRFFWKVMAAIDPDNAASLIVEAYLTAQMDGNGVKIPLSTRFPPEMYRVRVSDIERLSGLDFGELVRAADAGAQLPLQNATLAATQGGNLAAGLQRIVGPDEAVRKAGMQRLLDAIRGDSYSDSELRTLVEGILSLAGAGSFPSLGPEARVNVLTLLAAVPKPRWSTDRWIDLEATARRAVADAAITLGGCANGSQACAQIAKLKPNLDWPLATGRIVYLQFAGMVRDDVKAIADKLKILDWAIPGQERTVAAAGYNEVRYGESDDDRRAAELLAADLRALGRSGVRAVKVGGGRIKGLEIWISI